MGGRSVRQQQASFFDAGGAPPHPSKHLTGAVPLLPALTSVEIQRHRAGKAGFLGQDPVSLPHSNPNLLARGSPETSALPSLHLDYPKLCSEPAVVLVLNCTGAELWLF